MVPADMRLIQVEALQADESALTGESQPVAKTTDSQSERSGSAPGGSPQSWFSRAVRLRSGPGAGDVVTATGMHTEIGRIASLIAGQ